MTKEKDKNLTPAKTNYQAKSAFPAATSPLSATSKKAKSPWRTPLFFFFLLVVISGGWFLFALNRPGIEIKSGATPGASVQAAQPGPGQTAITQASAQATTSATPGPSGAAIAPTPTLIVAKNPTKPQIQGYGVVTSKILNLRSAPNTDATVIKSLKSGDIVELSSRSGGWYQTTEGLWVSAAYMEVRQTRAEAESYARELATS
ncbi:MAG: SH3 domain-containing protein [Chloroflexi bacterium]|nr:SH3 domain-containing protein [Chloroflexota bacterium]OJV96339.1 MAG: hypothetical protein BGO39_01095 [Chloroflexi bacterium 54-19]